MREKTAKIIWPYEPESKGWELITTIITKIYSWMFDCVGMAALCLMLWLVTVVLFGIIQ